MSPGKSDPGGCPREGSCGKWRIVELHPGSLHPQATGVSQLDLECGSSYHTSPYPEKAPNCPLATASNPATESESLPDPSAPSGGRPGCGRPESLSCFLAFPGYLPAPRQKLCSVLFQKSILRKRMKLTPFSCQHPRS